MKKIYLVVFLQALAILFSCSTHHSIIPDSNRLVSTWQGTFKSNYHTDGVIALWKLYDDGTMTGTWETRKGSSPIRIEGVWQQNHGRITFNARGILRVKESGDMNVRVSGRGILLKQMGSGTFRIFIDHPDFKNDQGTWDVTSADA